MSLNSPGRILAATHDRVELLIGLISAAAFFRTHPDARTPDLLTLVFPLDGDAAERKAEADRIAAQYGAVTAWRNGRYYASRSPEPEGGFVTELHFAPAIPPCEEDAA